MSDPEPTIQNAAFQNAEIKHATLLRILAAMVYDSFLLFAVAFAYVAICIAFTHFTGLIDYQDDFSQFPSGPLFELGLAAMLVAFYAGFWRHGGQTLGMRAWRMKLVSADGGRPSWRQCLTRMPLAFLSLLLLGIGYLWSIFDRENATLHDRLTGTRIRVLPKQ